MNKEKEYLNVIATALAVTARSMPMIAEEQQALTALNQERWSRTQELVNLANALHIQLPSSMGDAQDSAVIKYIASQIDVGEFPGYVPGYDRGFKAGQQDVRCAFESSAGQLKKEAYERGFVDGEHNAKNTWVGRTAAPRNVSHELAEFISTHPLAQLVATCSGYQLSYWGDGKVKSFWGATLPDLMTEVNKGQ